MSAPRSGSYRVPWGRVLLGTVVVLGIAGLYATLPVHETLPSLVRRIAALGPWADAVFVLVYAVASVLLFPAWLLTLAGGAVFGVARGSVLVLTGATLGAIASFVLARTGLREFVLKRARAYPDFESLDRAIAARGGWIVFLVRLSPVFPFVYVNYLLGLTAIPAATYTAATIVGMIPATVVYVAIGASAGAAASGQAASWSTLRIALTFAGVAAAVVVSIIVARIATGAVRKTGAEETLRESPLPRE